MWKVPDGRLVGNQFFLPSGIHEFESVEVALSYLKEHGYLYHPTSDDPVTFEIECAIYVADQLDELQRSENEGRGVGCVKAIVVFLMAEQIDEAKTCAHNEWDKIRSYPTIVDFLKKKGLAEEKWI